MIVDRFGNNKIYFVFDHDGDGALIVPDPDGPTNITKENLPTDRLCERKLGD